MEEVLHVGLLIEEHSVRSQSAAANAKVYVAVISLRSFVCGTQLVEEHVAALGRLACARDGEVINEQTQNAVVVLVGLMNEATWISRWIHMAYTLANQHTNARDGDSSSQGTYQRT